MALFKLRKKVDEPVAAPAPAESIEAMRRRARHRLIGAAVLVLAGVIGFPLLFDTQPRPVSVDIPIEIPDRNKVAPLPAPSPAASGVVGEAASAPPSAAAKNTAPAVQPVAAAPESKPVSGKVAQAAPAAEGKPQAKAETQAAESKAAASKAAEAKAAEAKAAADAKAAAEAKAAADDAARARALLQGKTVDTAADAGRYVVQVGAFAERDKAHQAQLKLQRAGLKNYTQVADTGDGKRIRVRAGPFASRAEADKAAQKIKSLDLPVRILAL